MHEEIKLKIVKLYFYTKKLIILAEQNDIKHKIFFRTVQAHRDVLEHYMRAKARELGELVPGDTGAYQEEKLLENLKASLRHQYLAFFETADWLGTTLRIRTKKMLRKFSVRCVKDVFPEYYDTLEMEMEDITDGIARIRLTRDIPVVYEEAFALAEDYYNRIESLLIIRKKIVKKMPALAAHRRQLYFTSVFKIIIPLLAAFMGAFFMWCFSCAG